jgi:DNA repair protein RadC
MSMSQETDLQDMIMSQLQMIEYAYEVTITNKEEVSGWINHATHNPREILTIALALNNWVAVNHPGRIFVIPKNIVQQIVAGTVGRW